mgnify:CR=1 FL=1
MWNRNKYTKGVDGYKDLFNEKSFSGSELMCSRSERKTICEKTLNHEGQRCVWVQEANDNSGRCWPSWQSIMFQRGRASVDCQKNMCDTPNVSFDANLQKCATDVTIDNLETKRSSCSGEGVSFDEENEKCIFIRDITTDRY